MKQPLQRCVERDFRIRLGAVRRYEGERKSRLLVLAAIGLTLAPLMWLLSSSTRRRQTYLVLCTGRISQVLEPLEWIRRSSEISDRRIVLVGHGYGNEYMINRIAAVDRSISRWSDLHLLQRSRLLCPGSLLGPGIVSHSRPFATTLPPVCTEVAIIDGETLENQETLLHHHGLPRGQQLALLGLSEPEYYSSRRFREKASARFSCQRDFAAMSERLVGQHVRVVRWGSRVGPLSAELSEAGVFDYAGICRSPEGDIALARRCAFAISDAAGAWWLTIPFGKPTLLTNVYLIRHCLLGPTVTMLPSLYWDTYDHRLLSVGEMFYLPKHAARPGSRLEMIRCEPESIADAAYAVLTRDTKRPVEDECVEIVQDELARLSGGADRSQVCNIDASFVRRHWKTLRPRRA